MTCIDVMTRVYRFLIRLKENPVGKSNERRFMKHNFE